MRTSLRRWAAGLIALSVATVLLGGAMSAHERRNVGPYVLVVGWLNEPTYVGLLNGAFISVSDSRTGQPVNGLEKTLQVELTYGGSAPTRLALKIVPNRPGAYAADVIPTRTGVYIFRFSGKIEDLAVDEKFESGPGRFDEPKAASEIEFPARPPASEPSDLTARVLAGVALVAGLASLALVLVRTRGSGTRSQ
ncbi:MAG: hypothetical protein M3O91_06450 [Chloroflexota bacterium]|nr:hypothetical protein [Chloroflexota bacterium]